MAHFVERNVRLRFEEKHCPHPVTGCWNWLGAKVSDGYSMFWDGNKYLSGHRFAYEIYKGAIPEGLQIDHLCRNRGCVNPEHLEAVTAKINMQRGRGSMTHCKLGHPLDHRDPKSGKRSCTTCRREAAARFERSGKRKPRSKSVAL